MRALVCLLAVALLVAAPASASSSRTLVWAQARANRVQADLTDDYGLTLRFGAVRGSAGCAGVGASLAASGVKTWRVFRCHARLRAEEGNMFPSVVEASFLLAASGEVGEVRVTRCTGKACPVH